MQRSKRPMTRRAFAASGATALASLGMSRLAFGQAQQSLGRSAPIDVEKANVALVNEFCAAFARKDIATLASSLAENCTYRITQTRPPIVGKSAVLDTVKGFLDRGVDFKVLSTVALGPIVLNERDDLLGTTAGQPARTIRVNAGMFFVQDGKIVEWTDYIIR